MKKLLMGAALALCMAAGIESQAGIADKIALYVPNRIVDAVDMVDLSLGIGPSAKADIILTRACALGAGVGPTVKMIKAANRQYGFAKEAGWNASFLCLSAEDYDRTGNLGYTQEYMYKASGMPLPSEKIYDFDNGARDYWAIEASFALLVAVDVGVHPVEIADFVTGFVFIDLKGDDFTFDDAKK